MAQRLQSVLVLGGENQVVHATPLVSAFLCSPLEELVGSHFPKFVVPEERGLFDAAAEKARSAGSFVFRTHLRPRGKSPRRRHLHMWHLGQRGQVRLTVVAPDELRPTPEAVSPGPIVAVPTPLARAGELIRTLRGRSEVVRSCTAVMIDPTLPIELRRRAHDALSRECDASDAKLEELLENLTALRRLLER